MSDLVIRAPKPEELNRAVYLFRNGRLRPQSNLIMAVRSRPVERFVAGAAWWVEGPFMRFHLAGQPGGSGSEIFDPLIQHVAARAQTAGLTELRYADLLTEDDELSVILRRNEFKVLSTDRFFETDYQTTWNRVMGMFEKYQAEIPSGWRTESIRQHPPEAAWELIQKHGLMPPAELNHHWQTASPDGFDLDGSSFLMEGTQRIGIMLLRTMLNTQFVDVRVVRVENRRRRALGNLLLFRHLAVRWNPAGPVNRLQFRGGETEHRETANLAFRMGGRELPPRHIFAKKL